MLFSQNAVTLCGTNIMQQYSSEDIVKKREKEGSCVLNWFVLWFWIVLCCDCTLTLFFDHEHYCKLST